jgi:asparagine synthase (glutamine-hydrolysing)
VSKVAREKVTVALSGDGGDENFLGYRRYAIDGLEQRLRRWFPRSLLALAGRVYPKADWLPRPLRAKTTLSNAARDPAAAYCFSMSWFKENEKRGLLAPGVLDALAGHETVELFRHYYDKAEAPDHLSRLQYLDIKTYLCDDILVKVDRASMAVSLEVRCPILDHVFMEQVARIPSARKLHRGEGKHIFKRAFERHLPHDILYRKKMGFVVPILEWLRTDLKDYAHAHILEGAATQAYFRPEAVRRIWNQHQSGLRNYAMELWILLMFNLWHERFVEAPEASYALP